MHKNTLWLILAILCIYFALVFCEEYTYTAVKNRQGKDLSALLSSDATALKEEARTRRKHRHHLYSLWGFYGLAIAYLIKIKVIVAAFFVGSAVYLGLRYWWPQKCIGGEIYREGSVVLDHPPSFRHYDHIPHSLDHDQHYSVGSFGSSGPTSLDPYAAYSSHSYSESDGSFPSTAYTESGDPHESFSPNGPNFRRKRSSAKYSKQSEATGILESEEQIGDFILRFLGLDTNACRKRFVCEMEFKSKANPLTSMAFRVIGRSLFAKYINSHNTLRKANSFETCAAVNAECVFIENNEETLSEETASEEQEEANTEGNDVIEEENENNLKRELNTNSHRRRLKD